MSDVERLVEQMLGDEVPDDLLTTPLPDEDAAVVIDRLKQEADHYWWIDANHSLVLANRIVAIGQARGDLAQIALGTMARGDALKLVGKIPEAWQTLNEAGDLYRAAGDEIGWGRTRIGRLVISVDLERVDDALEDAERAREIFTRHNDSERLIRLDINTAIVYDQLGDHQRALELNQSALERARALGPAGENYFGLLYANIGYAYTFLGEFEQALAYARRALAILKERQATTGIAVVEFNIAYIAQAQGYYRRALNMLHRVLEPLADHSPAKYASARRVMVECYLALNRYIEARDLAQQVVADFKNLKASYEMACALRHLATAEAELGNYPAAYTALDEAEKVFRTVETETWIGTLHLRRGRIALRQGNTFTAQQEAHAAAERFEQGHQQINYATALLLEGEAKLAEGNLEAAATAAENVLLIAQRSSLPALRYSAHVLLGRMSEAQGHPHRAIRRYQAATATIERVQRSLSITLRPGFLEDKGEAQRALMRLYLKDNRIGCAFETLEHAKSQVLLGYLAHRDTLRWAQDDPRMRALADELAQLRTEHQRFYHLAYGQFPDKEARAIDPQQALSEVTARERRMRSITEQLYLHNEQYTSSITTPSLDQIRANLPDDALLIEFYNDGRQVWAFTLDHAEVNVYPLPLTVQALDQHLRQLQFNLACALRVNSQSSTARSLTGVARRWAQQIYEGLMLPLESHMVKHSRLVIVPYGSLHYLPFHVLYDGNRHLIEQYEIVILPTAGLATQRGPQRAGGVMVLAHSLNGYLPETLAEARMVSDMFAGKMYCDQDANRSTLLAPPGQILHIAAHGQYRIDQPDLSYIELADGQLYTDDLLQHDLSYELVTLSACETGRANVAAGDELIGLGRGFLYAGAGALIASLWRVGDTSTSALMSHVYGMLRKGESKAAALRGAQKALLEQDPLLHPAYWGAFQLIGDAHPLSTSMSKG